MKKTNTLFSLLITLLLAFCIPSALAQQDPGPPLAETMDFIKQKLLDYSYDMECSAFRAKAKTTSVSVSGSVLRYAVTGKDECDNCDGQQHVSKYMINFAEIDPNSIKVYDGPVCNLHFYNVRLETSTGAKTIRIENAGAPDQLVSRFDIDYRDEEGAKRLAKAIKHAVLLSGGQPGLFGP